MHSTNDLLIDNGVADEDNLNPIELTEECVGCEFLDDSLNVNNYFLFPCCMANETINRTWPCISTEKYERVKGMDAFDKVWANIKKYTDHGVFVRVKYIFLPENSNDADMDGFICSAVKAGVRQVSLSVNFFRNRCTDDELKRAAKMMVKAEQNGLVCVLESTYTPDESGKINQFAANLRG